MGLRQGRIVLFEGRTLADIGHRIKDRPGRRSAVIEQTGPGGIDAVSGQKLVFRSQVQGWEAKMPPALIPLDHPTTHREGAAHHLFDHRDVAVVERLSDPCRADIATRHPNLWNHGHRKAETRAELGQKPHRAFPIATVVKIVPDVDLCGGQAPVQDLPDKALGRHLGELGVKGFDHQEIDPRGAQNLDFLVEGEEQAWRRAPTDHFSRVGLEGEKNRRSLEILRPLDHRLQNRAVSQVQPVEIADRHDGPFRRGNEFTATPYYSHSIDSVLVGVLSRYFVTRFFVVFFVSLIILVLAVVVVEMLADLGLAFGDEGWGGTLLPIALRVPALYLGYLIPVAIFVAVFVCFGVAARRSELVAAKAGGISPLRTALPVILASGVVALSTFALSESLGVAAHRELLRLESGDPSELSFRQGAFWYRRGAFTYRVADAGDNRQALRGVTIYEQDERGRLIRRIHAERAEQPESDAWDLDGVRIDYFSPGRPADAPQSETFETTRLRLGDEQALFEARPDALTMRDLAAYTKSRPPESIELHRARTLLQGRLSEPLVAIPFAMLAAALGISVERKRSLARSAIPGIIAILVFYLARRSGATMSAQGLLGAPLYAWGTLAAMTLWALFECRRAPR